MALVLQRSPQGPAVGMHGVRPPRQLLPADRSPRSRIPRAPPPDVQHQAEERAVLDTAGAVRGIGGSSPEPPMVAMGGGFGRNRRRGMWPLQLPAAIGAVGALDASE